MDKIGAGGKGGADFSQSGISREGVEARRGEPKKVRRSQR